MSGKKDFKEYIEKNIIPQYADFEKSHGMEHIRTVIKNSLDIVEELGLDVNLDMVYVIAAFHDIGMPRGRDDHHITSAEILSKDETLRRWFSEGEIILMKEAVEDHRASSKTMPRSIYGRIVAEADRDIEPYRIVKRCVQFETKNNPGLAQEDIIQLAKDHIVDKYGENGYLKLCLDTKRNQDGLNQIRTWIETGEIDDIIKEGID